MVAFWGQFFLPWICLRFLVSVPCFPSWFGLSTNPMYFFFSSWSLHWLDLFADNRGGWCPVPELNWRDSTVRNMFGFSRRRVKLGRWILRPVLWFLRAMFLFSPPYLFTPNSFCTCCVMMARGALTWNLVSLCAWISVHHFSFRS